MQPFGASVFNCFHSPFLPKTITTYHNHTEQAVKIYFIFLIYQCNGFKLNSLVWAVSRLILSGGSPRFLFIPGKETASLDLSHS